MNYQHYIITRAQFEDEQWAKDRGVLYQSYTMKSIERQTNKDFIFVIITNHPEYFPKPEGVETIYIQIDHFAGVDWLPRGKELESLLITKHTHSVTTRLDCDDYVEPEFVEEIHKNIAYRDTRYIIDFQGWAQKPGEGRVVYDAWDKEHDGKKFFSAFITLVEPMEIENPFRVYRHTHLSMRFLYPAPHYKWIKKRLFTRVLHPGQVHRVKGRKAKGK